MAQITSLSSLALPGRTQTFAAKAAYVPAADVWALIAHEGYGNEFWLTQRYKFVAVHDGLGSDGLYLKYYNGAAWVNAHVFEEPE